MVNLVRQRVLAGELLFGMTANLGSSVTVEMIGAAGFDRIWIDGEHGLGGLADLVYQLQAAGATPAAQVVRAMRYPPEGIRGIARTVRANTYGFDFDSYYTRANRELLTASCARWVIGGSSRQDLEEDHVP